MVKGDGTASNEQGKGHGAGASGRENTMLKGKTGGRGKERKTAGEFSVGGKSGKEKIADASNILPFQSSVFPYLYYCKFMNTEQSYDFSNTCYFLAKHNIQQCISSTGKL